MSDRVIGIAVLDRAAGQLAIWGQRADGRKIYINIPVYAEGQPKQHEQQWCYREKADVLSVTPSVRVSHGKPGSDPDKREMVEVFHNDFAWCVQFIERPPADAAGNISLWDRIHLANPGFVE